MDKERIKGIISRPLSRRGLVNVRRLAWAINRDIQKRKVDILRKHCGVDSPKKLNPKHPFLGYTGEVDPATGKINLKFNPMNITEDVYFPNR